MTHTPPQSFERPRPDADGLVRLPEVELPPAPSFGRQARFVSLVLLGYVYVLGVLGFFAALFISLLAAGAIWPLFIVGAVFVVVVPALRVKVVRPQGLRLSAANAPHLLELVERLRRELRASRLSGVLLVEEPTAYVCEVPRLGVLGWNRIYLVLGLPYVLALTPSELEAIVAHELAHVARRHGAGLTGLRGSLGRWQQLDARLDERLHWSGKFFRPFLRRYLPRLERATLAFSRWHEYEADQAAAAAAGVDAAANGLLRISLLDQHLDETLWDEVIRSADLEPRPPAPFSLMRQAARQEFSHGQARLAELLRHVDSDWTHPALAQRLRAIGVTTIQPSRLKPPASTAADVYLEPGLHELIAQFDESWQSRVSEVWRDRYEQSEALRDELAALEDGGDRSPAGRHRGAALTARLTGSVAARKQFEQLLRDDDQDAVAHYWVGRALLDSGDDRGLDSLARAADLDVHATPDAAEHAIAFLIDSGRLEEVDRWRARAQEYGMRAAVASEERMRLRPTDQVEPHGLPPETVDLIRQELVGLSRIRRAYLVRKHCSEFSEEPVWIVGIALRSSHLRLQRQRHVDELIQTVIERLGVFLDDHLWVVIIEGAYAPLAPAMEAVPDARVVGRRSRTARLRRRAGLGSYAVAALVVIIATVGLVRLLDSGTDEQTATYMKPGALDFDPQGKTQWAMTVNARCSSIRARYGVPPDRDGQLRLEAALLDALAAPVDTAPGSVAAIGLAQSRLASLERAQAHARAGQPARATAALRKHDASLGVQRSLTALGAPACAAP
jgi:Zn-dependent protease with chaperone function